MSNPLTVPYAVLKPCIDMQGHHFAMQFPQFGQQGTPAVICQRCGMVR